MPTSRGLGKLSGDAWTGQPLFGLFDGRLGGTINQYVIVRGSVRSFPPLSPLSAPRRRRWQDSFRYIHVPPPFFGAWSSYRTESTLACDVPR